VGKFFLLGLGNILASDVHVTDKRPRREENADFRGVEFSVTDQRVENRFV
jgi:hypothetical protein